LNNARKERNAEMIVVRRICQGAVLGLWGVAFLGALGGSLEILYWFPRASPLLAISVQLADRAWLLFFLPALLIALTGLLSPRFFCGWLCPAGTLIGIADTLFHRKNSRRRLPSVPGLQRAALAVILLAALFGANIAGLLDPLALLTRTVTSTGAPTWQDLHAAAPFLPSRPMWGAGRLAVNLGAAAMLALMLGLTFFGRRTWCRTSCPLGAFYGLLGPFAVLKRKVGEGCTHCSACANRCPMGAISGDGSRANTALCISCRQCEASCPKGAVRFAYARDDGAWEEAPPDHSRRRFLKTAGIALVSLSMAGVLRKMWFSRTISDELPPNVTDEADFASRCIRCAACVRVCPTKTLVLAPFSRGPRGLWLPIRDADRPCFFPMCHNCGEVCPTEAIPWILKKPERESQPAPADKPEFLG